jgi:RND family efflux transporter MFP subunit
MQARSELESARSDAALASTTARRWQSLAATELVSRQETDEKVADLSARQAQANALQANVDRLRAMQRFTRLVAPFDGVVTARNTDVGALINGGMTTDSALFEISDVRRLRVYVDVPQSQIASIRNGGQAELVVPERPNETFTATVESMARSIDAGSGAMRVQLSVDNNAGHLLPGGFTTVRFAAGQASASSNVGVPPSALIVGKNGVQVAVLGPNEQIDLRQVRISSDRGNVIELAGGVSANDRVVANPPDGLQNGTRVRVAALVSSKQ